jgi:hypothetical protein
MGARAGFTMLTAAGCRIFRHSFLPNGPGITPLVSERGQGGLPFTAGAA